MIPASNITVMRGNIDFSAICVKIIPAIQINPIDVIINPPKIK